MISSDSLAIGPDGAYPAEYYPDRAFEVLLTDNREALRRELTLPPPEPGVDRSLDLLVINQGHGGIGSFDYWSADDLSRCLVAPLHQSGVRASVIVLDFCLSASLIHAFAPLCANGGMIIANLYSIPEVLMTSQTWRAIHLDLANRNLGGIQLNLAARAQAVTASVTGLSHIHDVLSWSEGQTQQYLAMWPADRDAISIARYLPRIAQALQDPSAAPAQVFADLLEARASPSLGYGERAVLAAMPPAIGTMTPEIVAQITQQLRDRLAIILTQPSYGLQLEVAGKPLFGPHGLWHFVHENRLRLLALAQGLAKCPTPFAVFLSDNKALQLDAALAAEHLDPQTISLLRRIEHEAPDEAQQILRHLLRQQIVSSLTTTRNFLQ
jgi:hypothetical protein